MSILQSVLEAVEARPGGAIVFDLDSTLFDNGPRSHRIMLEWAHKNQPSWAGAVASASRYRMDYSLAENAAGIEGWNPDWLDPLKKFWFDRFFDDRYINFDEPIDGAPAFVRAVRERGARIVYLTGRDVPGMWAGTCESLRAWDFPVGEPGVDLVLKPDFVTEDSVFKAAVIDGINNFSHGVVATFENEAKNLHVMRDAWPEALHILLDTNWDPRHPEHLREGFPKLHDFVL